jgi:hypothetical protein
MNGAKAEHKFAVSEAVAHGACPVCTVLRHRQTRLVQEEGLRAAAHLCNHHAWALARSAPAALAAEVFLQSIHLWQREGLQGAAAGCDFCDILRREEAEELKALAEKMEVPSFLEWMTMSGTLCLRHACKVDEQLPAKARGVIAELVLRTLGELERDLEGYRNVARLGSHSGGGVLGRAAEFLVCQRGISGEETPC